MSEYMVVEPEAFFYTLPDDMPVELGALVEPLSVASHVLERAAAPGNPPGCARAWASGRRWRSRALVRLT